MRHGRYTRQQKCASFETRAEVGTCQVDGNALMKKIKNVTDRTMEARQVGFGSGSGKYWAGWDGMGRDGRRDGGVNRGFSSAAAREGKLVRTAQAQMDRQTDTRHGNHFTQEGLTMYQAGMAFAGANGERIWALILWMDGWMDGWVNEGQLAAHDR
ncbi:hypothetical protein LY76DRAFT_140298 [Colletotrichum caudatum]|nr:hypothetical protein LY76DRAFT_140298 [Colletotrichum caudatum]